MLSVVVHRWHSICLLHCINLKVNYILQGCKEARANSSWLDEKTKKSMHFKMGGGWQKAASIQYI